VFDHLTSTYVAVIFQFLATGLECIDMAVIALKEYLFGDRIPDSRFDDDVEGDPNFSNSAAAALGTIPGRCQLNKT
jgi:hypothetical protein